ncbi:hypothetical protein EJB05_25748, partial [Eragrostis curvula]
MAMVSASLGPINSLLDKLPAEPEFTDLRQSLEDLRQHLLRFSARGAVRSKLVQQWMKLLRELAYDVDDWMDSLLIRPWGRFKIKWWPSRQLARIQEFKDKIRNMLDYGASFGIINIPGIDHPAAAADELVSSNRSSLGWIMDDEQKPCLVGLDGPRSEIVQHLMDDEQMVKVICIVGPGGIGKTTLAREVFGRQRSQFDCGAFVQLGRNPSVVATLIDIARQVMPKSLFPCDDKLIAKKLWEFLGSKRYFIVIEDIWCVSAWCNLMGVLPENNLGSRVLATTEFKHVANSCGVKSTDFIYLLKALSESDSRSLMLSRIYASDEDCTVDSKIIQSLVKVCGGTPLAVSVAGGLLAAQPVTLIGSRVLEKATLSPLNQDSTSQVMEKLLEISYADLPLHVKSCFLYLSTFPENKTIKKDRLIHRWICEGFISASNEETYLEIGERYFSELAIRRLIQPVFDGNDDGPIGCSVHSVILDFISSLSSEENFVTLGSTLSHGSYPRDTVRRFTVDCNKQDETNALASNSVHLSRVRSFIVCGNAKKRMPDLSTFKLLRVLDLEDTEILEYHQLKSIGNLPLLRYLGLQGTGIAKLPKQILMLENLNALDLRRTMVTQLPTFGTLKLASLLVDRLHLQRGMGEMRCMEELSMVLVTPIRSENDPSKIPVDGSDSLDDAAQLVSKSKKLRMLAVRFDSLFGGTKTYRQEGVMQFLDEVAKSSIQSLILHDYPCSLVDLLVDCWSCTRPDRIRKFELRIDGHLSKIPQKIASLLCLMHLHIKVYEVEAEGLHILGKLPNLILLCLISEFGSQERLTITRDCFQCLKVFLYYCQHHAMGLQFEPGAMPQLQRLRISFEPLQTKSDYGNFSFGIQYLTRLAGVHAAISCWLATTLELESAKAAIREQVSQIPNTPILEFSREDELDTLNG